MLLSSSPLASSMLSCVTRTSAGGDIDIVDDLLGESSASSNFRLNSFLFSLLMFLIIFPSSSQSRIDALLKQCLLLSPPDLWVYLFLLTWFKMSELNLLQQPFHNPRTNWCNQHRDLPNNKPDWDSTTKRTTTQKSLGNRFKYNLRHIWNVKQ